MYEKVLENYRTDALESFRSYKKMAEKAMAQVSDEEFFHALDLEANSIAVIVKHIGGNLRSRWTRFLTTDGEKPDRERDTEFIAENDTRSGLMEFWESGWAVLFDSLESLKTEDLGKIVKIRGEDYTVVKAINRAMMHAASHVGQIVLLSKHFRSSEWKTLSIPRNKSAEFNKFVAEMDEKGNYLEAPQEFAEKELK